jgi:hypothetical protein
MLSLLSVRASTHVKAESARHASFNLARHFAKIAEMMPHNSQTANLLKSFRICGQCNNFKRFGESHDGGYLMCMDGLTPGKTQAAYSLGVEHHDKWSEDVTKALGASVNQFDCTVSEGSGCPNCKFFKKCIVSADGQHPVPGHEKEGWTLKEVLAHTHEADAPDGTLLMKMDIESSEWPIYASEHGDSLKKFGQIIVEFHGFQFEDKHPTYLKAIQNLLGAGFQIVHLHGNNYGGMYQSGELQIPQVLEVTFVHGGARPNGCLNDQVFEDLDAPNNPTANELPMAHLLDNSPKAKA